MVLTAYQKLVTSGLPEKAEKKAEDVVKAGIMVQTEDGFLGTVVAVNKDIITVKIPGLGMGEHREVGLLDVFYPPPLDDFRNLLATEGLGGFASKWIQKKRDEHTGTHQYRRVSGGGAGIDEGAKPKPSGEAKGSAFGGGTAASASAFGAWTAASNSAPASGGVLKFGFGGGNSTGAAAAALAGGFSFGLGAPKQAPPAAAKASPPGVPAPAVDPYLENDGDGRSSCSDSSSCSEISLDEPEEDNAERAAQVAAMRAMLADTNNPKEGDWRCDNCKTMMVAAAVKCVSCESRKPGAPAEAAAAPAGGLQFGFRGASLAAAPAPTGGLQFGIGAGAASPAGGLKFGFGGGSGAAASDATTTAAPQSAFGMPLAPPAAAKASPPAVLAPAVDSCLENDGDGRSSCSDSSSCSEISLDEPEEDNAERAAQVAAMRAMLADTNNPKEGDWRCDNCKTMMVAAAVKCVSCESRKPGAPAEAAAAPAGGLQFGFRGASLAAAPAPTGGLQFGIGAGAASPAGGLKFGFGGGSGAAASDATKTATPQFAFGMPLAPPAAAKASPPGVPAPAVDPYLENDGDGRSSCSDSSSCSEISLDEPEEDNAERAAQVAAMRAMLADTNNPKEGDWRCDNCKTMMVAAAVKCVSCESRKPGAPAEAAAAPAGGLQFGFRDASLAAAPAPTGGLQFGIGAGAASPAGGLKFGFGGGCGAAASDATTTAAPQSAFGMPQAPPAAAKASPPGVPAPAVDPYLENDGDGRSSCSDSSSCSEISLDEPEEDNAERAAQVAAMRAMLADTNNPKEGDWRCDNCKTMMVAAAVKCVSCESRKPGAPAEAAAAPAGGLQFGFGSASSAAAPAPAGGLQFGFRDASPAEAPAPAGGLQFGIGSAVPAAAPAPAGGLQLAFGSGGGAAATVFGCGSSFASTASSPPVAAPTFGVGSSVPGSSAPVAFGFGASSSANKTPTKPAFGFGVSSSAAPQFGTSVHLSSAPSSAAPQFGFGGSAPCTAAASGGFGKFSFGTGGSNLSFGSTGSGFGSPAGVFSFGSTAPAAGK